MMKFNRQDVQERRMIFDESTGQFRPHQPAERYVRAIPFDWLHTANRLPGRAISVALALWFLAGVKKSMNFRLTAEAVDLAGCSRKALYRGLDALEGAGLIGVVRRSGARPLITINEFQSQFSLAMRTADNSGNWPKLTVKAVNKLTAYQIDRLDKMESQCRARRNFPVRPTSMFTPILIAEDLGAADLLDDDFYEAFVALDSGEQSRYVINRENSTLQPWELDDL